MRKLIWSVSLLTLLSAGVVIARQNDVGTPAFRERASNTMTLRYGFRGAAVLDQSTKQWAFIAMTTITRGRVDGYVNQVNDQFALAAGLNSVAVYDYSLHRWVEMKPAGADDSSGDLPKNFVLTPTMARVKTLNGPWVEYTTRTGWVRK